MGSIKTEKPHRFNIHPISQRENKLSFSRLFRFVGHILQLGSHRWSYAKYETFYPCLAGIDLKLEKCVECTAVYEYVSPVHAISLSSLIVAANGARVTISGT